MKIVRCVILVAVCVLVGRFAIAQAPAKPAAAAVPAEGASGGLSMLPEEVDLAVVVERGSEIRASKWGDAIGRVVGDVGTIGKTNEAWDSLATQFGWSRNEAFDRLLGGRVTLASKAMGNGGERRWVLLSDVSPETEQRLKERLLAAPRAIVEGHQILTLENGEYELATHHWPNPARGKKGPADRVTLVLCAMGKSELFDQVLARMNAAAGAVGAVGGMAPLDVVAQAKAAEELAGKESPTVLFVASLADGNAAGRAPWSDFVMLAGQPIECDVSGAGGAAKVGPTWRMRVVVRQAARREELLAIEPTSDAPFRALSTGSLVAAVQTAPLPEVIGNWARFTTLGSLLPLPDEAKKAMTPHQAVSCRTVEPEGRVSCTFAMRAADTGAMARTLDGPIAAWIARVEKQLGAECPPMRDFAGVAPNAVRVVPFAEGKESAVGMISSKPLAVSWVFPSRPIGNPGAMGGQEPGWWVVNVSQMGVGKGSGPTAGEIVRGDADALVAGNAGGPGGEMARWVWLASARPGAVEKLLPASLPDLNGFRSAMKRLDRVDMRLKITEVGDIQGDMDVRLADADAPPGAGPVTAAPPNGK